MQISMLNFVPSLCGQTYLYGSHADASVSSRIVTALTMHIDPRYLEQALAEAMVRFPQLAVGLGVSEGKRVFVPVQTPVPVFRADEPMPNDFSDPRLCGYLFRISYNHKHLYVDFHRAIADEIGMMSFVKALLLRYLELSGFSVRTDGSVKLLSSEFINAESEDPMARMEDAYSSRPVWYMDAKAVSPDVDDVELEEVVQVRIPLNKLKKDYLELPNIPVTYVAPFLSHALHELLSGMMGVGEYVVASVQINLRPYYPSASLRPFHTPVLLAYNRNLSDYPYKTVLMSQKKLLEAQLKNDTVAYSAQRKMAAIEIAFDFADSLEGLDAAFDSLQKTLSKKSTYDICRIGNVILPESMQRLVTEFYSVIPSPGKTISVTVSTYRNELSVTVSGRKYSHAVCRRLVDLLVENDIDSYVADRYKFSPLVMK